PVSQAQEHPMHALALLAALTPSVVRADDPVALRWSLKEGDTFYLKQTITSEQTTEAGGRKRDMTSEVTTVIRFKVTAARDSGTVMEMTYLDVRASSPGGRSQSLDPNDRFAGASMTVSLDGKQNVAKLEGHAAFLDKLSGGDEATRKQMEVALPE